MPPAIAGPPPSMDPPRAFCPFTVWYSRADCFACGRIQCYYTAAELAAFVFRISAKDFLERRNPNVHDPLVIRRCISDYSCGMTLDMDFPHKLAAGSVERVHVSFCVAEEHRRYGSTACDNPGPNRRFRCELPKQAPSLRIHCIDFSCSRSDKQTSCRDHRLPARIGDVAKSECPAQMKLWNIRQTDSRGIDSLESRVDKAVSKSVPASCQNVIHLTIDIINDTR